MIAGFATFRLLYYNCKIFSARSVSGKDGRLLTVFFLVSSLLQSASEMSPTPHQRERECKLSDRL